MNYWDLFVRSRPTFRSPLLAILLSASLVSTAYPQENASVGSEMPEAGPRRETLMRWQHFVELRMRRPGESPWYDCILTPPVFDGARLDLADLRLYSADDREVPYALRVRREESELVVVGVTEFNRIQREDASKQVSLDLGDNQVQHNEVEILTTGSNFRRRAVIEASNDTETWNQLAAGYLIDYRRDEADFKDSTIDYPPSRFRYVRVTVHPDPQEDTDRTWDLRDVRIKRRVMLPGEYLSVPLLVSSRAPTRTPQGPSSQWLAHLGGTSVPCEELIVQIETNDFVRDWLVEAAGPDRPGENFYYVASGTWQRKAGDTNSTFVASFPQEIRAARLKLLVIDYRNPPLEISAMSYRAPARQLVFEAAQQGDRPLRLYFGNPDAEEPRYDFARNLPPQLVPPPARLEIGRRQINPYYRPKPTPFTERWPWLVHSCLAVVVLVLAGLIINLGRAALRTRGVQHPEREKRVGAGAAD